MATSVQEAIATCYTAVYIVRKEEVQTRFAIFAYLTYRQVAIAPCTDVAIFKPIGQNTRKLQLQRGTLAKQSQSLRPPRPLR